MTANKTKVFVLEDNGERIKFFNKMFQNYDYVLCETAKEAKKVLYDNEFNVIFLDHDLGGRIFVDSNEEETGMTVVKYIIEKELQTNALFFIHSQNPVGAANMLHRLMDDNRRAFLKSFTSIWTENSVGF